MLDVHHQQIHNEGLCLLYVAMTRAVHALHLFISPSPENERSLPKTYAGLLRAGLHDGSPTAPSQILYKHGDKNWFTQSALRSSETREDEELEPVRIQTRPEAKHRGRRLRRQTPSELEGGPRVDLRRQFREDSVLGRNRGSLWHAWLEHVDWLDEGPEFALPSDETLRRLAGPFLHPRLNLEEEIHRFREALALPALRQALSRPQYGPRELELYHNFPIAHRQHRVLMPGFIDRLVLLKQDGQVIAADVIDFKTEPLPRNDPQIVNQRGEYYEPQLSAYREAIQETHSLSQTAVGARLLFLDAGAEWRHPIASRAGEG
jgi:ATP-dependent exoDNAse (exonuclease V) beta subunit